MALAEKQQKFMNEWIVEKRGATYVKLKDEYKNCDFKLAKW